MPEDPKDPPNLEADERFQETLKRMLGTPPKPHAPLGKERQPKPAPKG